MDESTMFSLPLVELQPSSLQCVVLRSAGLPQTNPLWFWGDLAKGLHLLKISLSHIYNCVVFSSHTYIYEPTVHTAPIHTYEQTHINIFAHIEPTPMHVFPAHLHPRTNHKYTFICIYAHKDTPHMRLHT